MCSAHPRGLWIYDNGRMNLSDPNFQLELAANVAVAGSILLAGRNNVHTWWLGIVGCALFAVVFERSHLFADMVLQFFFIAISVLGWWQWLRGNHGAPLPITSLRPRTGCLLYTSPSPRDRG